MVRINKNILLGLFILCFGSFVMAEGVPNITDGMESYKNGNYQDCISKMKYIVKTDPTSVVGYYYLGLAYSKTGQKLLAIENYNKVINLNSDKTLTSLARQGKNALGLKTVSKIENQIEQIKEEAKEEEEYNPILNDGVGVNDGDSSDSEKRAPVELKTTQVIKASDYSQPKPQQNPNAAPTNDEIVNAIRVLQRAGLLQNGAAGLAGGQGGMQMSMPMDARTQQMNSMLMMMNGGNNNNNNMMQMMPYMNNGGKVDPQMMQMMLMNQMMPNFSNGGNNGNGY